MTLLADPPGAAEVPLLREDPPRLGPVTRRLLLRLLVGLGLVQAVGALLLLTGGAAARAAGTSLVFPGAGFLYVAHPELFVLTWLLMVVALVLWWGASAHLAIPVVWLAAVAGSAALADGPRLLTDPGTTWSWAVPAAYLLLVGSVGSALWRSERQFRAKRARIGALNAHLAALPAPSPRERVARTPDDMDVQLLRWVCAVADQPDDGLVGLDWGEQFHSGTQLRYQLNALCWALSLYAANMVPNAQTQVEASLARLIEKHTDLRVWGYWRTLNLLGNFDPDPDPIRRDNIMFSAFLGDVLNIYEAATGSDRFDQPGSLTFVWKDGRTFPYDHHRIAAAVESNYEKSRLGFFPCEPGWSFTVCNVMGAQSLLGHDVLHGTQSWDRVRPGWVRALDEEYATPDGSYAHIRSSLVGLSWDTGEVPGGHYLAAGSHRFADILPAHARRADALERLGAGGKIGQLASMVDEDGRLELELPAVLERSRARRSALAGWNGVVGGALLMGEHRLAKAAMEAAARQCGTGGVWPDRPLHSGLQALGTHMILRWSAPLGAADLNVRGYRPPVGPVLASTAWDQVLVVEARSPDGRALTLRLEPQAAPVPAAELHLTALQPGGRYRLTGDGVDAVVQADADGRGAVTVAVPGPVALVLEPAEAAA